MGAALNPPTAAKRVRLGITDSPPQQGSSNGEGRFLDLGRRPLDLSLLVRL
jgi:hypothetical protein